jgi:hypothetical protein
MHQQGGGASEDVVLGKTEVEVPEEAEGGEVTGGKYLTRSCNLHLIICYPTFHCFYCCCVCGGNKIHCLVIKPTNGY